MSEVDEFEEWLNSLPESKLELIDGKLIVGNSLVASKLLLRHILEGWGAAAAIALVDKTLCWEALKVVYPDMPISVDNRKQAQVWASQFVDYQVEDLSAGGQGKDCGHRGMRDFLSSQLRMANSFGNCGPSIGHDIVMHIGDNGFTPDIFLYRGKPLNQMYYWYLEGPADLVIEIILPAHAKQDREVKRHYYEAGGVPEYWIVDPQQQQVELLRLIEGQYQPQQLDTDERYRHHRIPNLTFIPTQLWQSHSYQERFTELSLFEIDHFQQFDKPQLELGEKEGGWQYDSLPFKPRIALESVSILFEEFISWCPEAKIEGRKDRLEVGDTKKFLGLSLMTLGMVETIKLLHPQKWVTALIEAEEEENELNDAVKKAQWWKIAKEAAALLREKHGATRLAVAGDLVLKQPLNFWSEITLVTWDSTPFKSDARWKLYQRYQNPRLSLTAPDDADIQHNIANNQFIEV